jgi:hypothetical protein
MVAWMGRVLAWGALGGHDCRVNSSSMGRLGIRELLEHACADIVKI